MGYRQTIRTPHGSYYKLEDDKIFHVFTNKTTSGGTYDSVGWQEGSYSLEVRKKEETNFIVPTGGLEEMGLSVTPLGRIKAINPATRFEKFIKRIPVHAIITTALAIGGYFWGKKNNIDTYWHNQSETAGTLGGLLLGSLIGFADFHGMAKDDTNQVRKALERYSMNKPRKPLFAFNKQKKLKRECIEGILVEMQNQGIETVQCFLDANQKDPQINTTVNELIRFKEINIPYSLRFHVLEDYSPIEYHPGRMSKQKWRKYLKENPNLLLLHELSEVSNLSYNKSANEKIPPGFIKPPIASSPSKEYRKYRETLEELGKIEVEKSRQRKKQEYEQKLKEWENRAKKQGSDAGSGSAIHLREMRRPSMPYLYGGDTYQLGSQKIKERGIERPKNTRPFLVYMAIDRRD